MSATVSPQPRPDGRIVMHQCWRRLLFLHWSWDIAAVQATLPPGLTVETWNGRAWIGLVPFAMRRVRPRFFPTMGRLSNFLELNVRTYVRDASGRPGVWFYSLDCSQSLAVWAARKFFGLPYHCADLRERRQDGVVYYHCQRAGSRAVAHFEYPRQGEATRAAAGSLEEFLLERYRLFAMRGGRMLTGEVWHEPYAFQSVELWRWGTSPLVQAGFDPGDAPPEHAVYAPGVEVEIFSPKLISVQ
jgi:uncharacterized protein YqjF (DUF2071 family)